MFATLQVTDPAQARLTDLRPEVDLLLTCARARLDAGLKLRVKTLAAKDIDWEYLLRLADRHGLQPLLYWHLNSLCASTVPDPHLQHLRLAFQRVSALNIFLTHELKRLLSLFAQNGIGAVPYKGPALALQLYGNVALRQFSDLDILVQPRDVLRARDLLLGEDYVPFPPLSDGQQAILLRAQCNLPFTRESNRLVVELHWTISAPHFARPFETADLWSRLQDWNLDDLNVKVLAPEDLLLALSVHGSKHLWERLAWICDIAGLIDSHPDLDWKQVIAQARATGSERMLFLGLRLAADLLEAKLPEVVTEALVSDPVVPSLSTQVVRYLFTPDRRTSGMAGYFLFQLRARRRLRDKFNYLRFIVTPTEEDLVRVRLPAPLTFLYYVMRPIRMAVTGGPNHFH
ncbi:MAG: nucleotidyltransferase domain-containing protein [Pyrinomonadaceae bacterium]